MKGILELQQARLKAVKRLNEGLSVGMGADRMFYEVELSVEENLVGLGIQDLIHDGVNVIPVDLKGGLVRNEIHKMIPVLVDIDDKAHGLLLLLALLLGLVLVLVLVLLLHFER